MHSWRAFFFCCHSLYNILVDIMHLLIFSEYVLIPTNWNTDFLRDTQITEPPLPLLMSWCSRPSTVQVFFPVIYHLCLNLWCCCHLNLVIVLHTFHKVLSELPTLGFPTSGVPDNIGSKFPHILCSVVLKSHLVAWKPGEYFCHVSRACMLRHSKQGTMCLPPFWCVQSCSRTSEPVNLHITQWLHFISEYILFEQKCAVFQVVTTGYHQSMCGRSCEPLLVPVRNSNRVAVAVVLRVRVWGNSCSWGSKFHQPILTPLAAWPSRFLPLVSDDCVENVAFSWTGDSTVY